MLFKKVYTGFLLIFFHILIVPRSAAQSDKLSLSFYKNKLKSSDKMSKDSVVYFYDKIISNESSKIKINYLRKKAVYLSKNNFFTEADEIFSNCLELVQKENFKETKAELYHSLGIHNYLKHEDFISYKYFLKSKKIYQELEDVNNLNKVNFNIASFLIDAKEYDEAEKLFYESLDHFNKIKDTVKIKNAKINLGILYCQQKRFAECRKTFDELLQNHTIDKSDRSLIYYNLAIMAGYQNNINDAEKHIDKAITISEEINDEIQLIDLYFYKANLETSRKNYDRAITLYNKSLKITEAINDLVFKEQLLVALIGVRLKTKTYSKLEPLYNELKTIKDSLKQQKPTNSFREVFLEYQIEEDEKNMAHVETKLLLAKKSRNFYWWISILGGFTLVLLGFSYYWYRRNTESRIKLIKERAKARDIDAYSKKKFAEYSINKTQDALKSKKRELLLAWLFTQKRQESLDLINKKIDRLASNSVITKEQLLEVKAYIVKKSKELDEEENVQQRLENTHKKFYDGLLLDFPKLSQTELKILAYLSLNMNTKEIAQIQNVGVDAIRKSRYRIRKKMGLQPKQSLEKFILQYN